MLRLGIGVNNVPLRGATGFFFSPAQLFAAGEQGVWYDPSDLSTLWQDTARTVPVTADGDPVRVMDDKSGNANHQAALTDSARPLYHTSGGLHWLETDGVDDSMTSVTSDFFTGKQLTIFLGQLWNPASGTALLYRNTAGTGFGDYTVRLFSGSTGVYSGPSEARDTVPASSGSLKVTTIILDDQLIKVRIGGANFAEDAGGDAPLDFDQQSTGQTLTLFSNITQGHAETKFYGAIAVNYRASDGVIPAAEGYTAAKSGVVIP